MDSNGLLKHSNKRKTCPLDEDTDAIIRLTTRLTFGNIFEVLGKPTWYCQWYDTHIEHSPNVTAMT